MFGRVSRPEYGCVRRMTAEEGALLKRLLRDVPSGVVAKDGLDILQVQDMPDGGMGSLYFVHASKSRDERRLQRRIAEFLFDDSDGVRVIASLNIDCEGDLFELDIWKTDFSRLIQISVE